MLDRFPIAGQALVLYHHAMDDAAKGYELGTFDTATVDDYGLWAEAQLEVAEKYKTRSTGKGETGEPYPQNQGVSRAAGVGLVLWYRAAARGT
jgi:hypothetical protein